MTYDQIQKLIDMGNGFAAAELGPPHDVYRIGNSSSGDVISPTNKIASGIQAITRVAFGGAVRESLETEKVQGLIWYRIVCDLRNFKVGDIFVVNDPVYNAGATSVPFTTDEFKGFALADHSPIKKAIGGRINCNVQVYRPSAGPNTNGQWDRTNREGQPLILANGAFKLGSAGATPSKIPAGLVATGKSYGDRSFDQVPAEKRKSGWELYMPALNGFNVREGDRIVGPDGARYIVIVPFTQHVGASGSQWFLEREAS